MAVLLNAMRRPAVLVGPLVLFTFIVWALTRISSTTFKYHGSLLESLFTDQSKSHNEVFSVSTEDRQYFKIDFGHQKAFNPNIIPHPVLSDTWIVVAQLWQEQQPFAELVCNAMFDNDTLRCVSHAATLPIAPTFGDKCTGAIEYFALNKGPHDARVFYGPHVPYTVFGSNSMFTCFGQWIQDFRSLIEWGYDQFDTHEFAYATELQRPPPWGEIEKNWFLFFDKDDQTYIHYDIAPKRVFAKLDQTGAVGPDLSLFSAAEDERCMQRYMPRVGEELEGLHQATNSLLITMCKRNDESCTRDESNTYIFTIFQHKTFFNYHALYDPYLLVFEQTPPFKTHGISKKPFWIHGRQGRFSKDDAETQDEGMVGQERVEKDELVYVTSISWKNSEQKYHGYMDDVLFVGFGIEDQDSAAIDVVASDLFQDLGVC